MGERDLGELFSVVARRLIELERPLLEAHGLTMWQYVVLSRLAEGPAANQIGLARLIGYDKTRLIRLLDGLVAEELITRGADPHDRRAHVVGITASGRARLEAARAEIRRMEATVLAELAPEARAHLRQQLTVLAGPRA